MNRVKRIKLENQNRKICAHDRTRECSREKISDLVVQQKKPPASETEILGRTHDCSLLGTASVSKFGYYTTWKWTQTRIIACYDTESQTIVFVSLLFSFKYKVNESLTNDNWHHQFPVRSFLVIQWISEPDQWSPITV